MALRVVKKASKYTTRELQNMAREYKDVSNQIKLLEDTKKILSESLKEATQAVGVKDSKGSYYFDCGDYMLGKVAKKSIKLSTERAETYLKEHGLYEEATTTKVVIDEDKLASLVSNGVIPQKDFESLCDITVNYSVSVKKGEEMPEVETTKAILVASKK